MAVCYDTKICLNAPLKLDLYTDFHEAYPSWWRAPDDDPAGLQGRRTLL